MSRSVGVSENITRIDAFLDSMIALTDDKQPTPYIFDRVDKKSPFLQDFLTPCLVFLQIDKSKGAVYSWR
jgi:hypothetical protein